MPGVSASIFRLPVSRLASNLEEEIAAVPLAIKHVQKKPLQVVLFIDSFTIISAIYDIENVSFVMDCRNHNEFSSFDWKWSIISFQTLSLRTPEPFATFLIKIMII